MLLLAVPAFAGVTLRNDTNTTDSYDTSDAVAWLEYPECAISVLRAVAGDLPLEIDKVQFFLASNQGNQDGTETLAEVSLQILADGEEPTLEHMEWGPEAFYVTVDSTRLNELNLVDKSSGLNALSYTEGSVAVWVCPPDPTTGESWPRVDNSDQSGIVIDTESPGAGSYLLFGSTVYELSNFSPGAWIIRAEDSSASGGGGDDTGGGGGGEDDTGDGGGGGDGTVAVASVTPTSAKSGEPVAIAVIGSGFQQGASVFMGGLAVSSVAVSGVSAISGTSPSALPAGTHDLVVTNPDGSSDTLEGAFTVEGGCGCGTGIAFGPWWAAIALVAWRRR